VQDQGVGLDHLHGAAALIYRVAIVELHGAQVGQEQHIRRHVAHAEGAAHAVQLDGGALAADAHRQPMLLRGHGQVAVDQLGLLGAAGHRTDEDRCGDGAAKERHTGIDGVQVQLWQRLMHETVAFQPCGQLGKLDILLQVDPNMIGFSLVDRQQRTSHS
jgi:hypothetical protein